LSNCAIAGVCESLRNFAMAIMGPGHDVLPETPPAEADKGRRAHLVHQLFDSLRGHSQHNGPVCRPSPAPILRRYGRQSCSKGVSGDLGGWLTRRFSRGARLCSVLGSLPGFLRFSPRLLAAGAHFFFESSVLRLRVACLSTQHSRMTLEQLLRLSVCYEPLCSL
jgi:hypothetical protein